MPECETRSPLRSLTARPVLALTLTALGVMVGVLAGYFMPVTHSAESRLAVVSATNNAYTIPGYPLAARELASDYARWVQNRASDGQWSPPGSTAVSASPIPDSAVIRVEVQAPTSQEAVAGADQVAQTLLQTVADSQAQHDPQRAYEDFRRQAPAVAQARARVQQAETAYSRAVGGEDPAARIDAASRALQQARVRLAELELQQNAAGDLYRRLYSDTQGVSALKVIAPAAPVGSAQRTAMMRYGVLGGGVAAFVALLLAVAADRRAHGARADTRGGTRIGPGTHPQTAGASPPGVESTPPEGPPASDSQDRDRTAQHGRRMRPARAGVDVQ